MTHIAENNAGRDNEQLRGAEDESRAFLLTEYQRLCAEVSLYLQEAFQCATYAILGSAVFWSWFVVGDGPKKVQWAVSLPAILCVVAGLKWLAIMRSLGKLSEYLQQVEGRFNLGGLGWELCLRGKKDKTTYRDIGMLHAAVFVLLIVLNIIFAATWVLSQGIQVAKP